MIPSAKARLQDNNVVAFMAQLTSDAVSAASISRYIENESSPFKDFEQRYGRYYGEWIWNGWFSPVGEDWIVNFDYSIDPHYVTPFEPFLRLGRFEERVLRAQRFELEHLHVGDELRAVLETNARALTDLEKKLAELSIIFRLYALVLREADYEKFEAAINDERRIFDGAFGI